MIVSVDCPPPIPDNASAWERQLDPFHATAILPALEQAGLAPPQELLDARENPIRDGWLLLDPWGNPTGWVPDGEEFPDDQRQDVEFHINEYGRKEARRKCA